MSLILTFCIENSGAPSEFPSLPPFNACLCTNLSNIISLNTSKSLNEIEASLFWEVKH